MKEVGSTGVQDPAAYTLLEDIFEELNEAYITANEEFDKGFALNKQEFTSNDDLDKHTSKLSYKDNALCFALAWEEFDPTNHKYSIDLRWNYGVILPPRRPQTEFEESKVN